MFLPLGSLRKVTKRGLGIAGVCGGFAIFCTTGFVDGDLNDNHRMFLNIEVIFCMKPELVELVFPVLFPFPPVDNFLPLLLDIDTKVDFFSDDNKEFVCSSRMSLSSPEEVSGFESPSPHLIV